MTIPFQTRFIIIFFLTMFTCLPYISLCVCVCVILNYNRQYIQSPENTAASEGRDIVMVGHDRGVQ